MSVLGNHDLSALRVYRGSKPVVPRQAGKYKWVEGMSEADARYLEALPCTISLAVKGRRYVVVHAGLVPGVPLGEQDARAMTTMRLVRRLEDGGAWVTTNDDEGAKPWAEVYEGEHGKVIFGHDAKRGRQVKDHAIGLDTGCVYGRGESGGRQGDDKVVTNTLLFDVEITAVRIGLEDGEVEFLSVPCSKAGGYEAVSGT